MTRTLSSDFAKVLIVGIAVALIATAFTVMLLPAVVAAQSAQTCISDAQCPSNEYCETSISSCLARPGSGGSGGSGALNTTRLTAFAMGIMGFINSTLFPLLNAIAFIVFLYGVYNYFILGASDEKKRETGRVYVMYAILGFVIIFSIWGLVRIGVDTLNLGGNTHPPYPEL